MIDFDTVDVGDGLVAVKHTEGAVWRIYDADDILFELPPFFPKGSISEAAKVYYIGVRHGDARGRHAAQREVRRALGIGS